MVRRFSFQRLAWLQRYGTLLHRFGGFSPFLTVVVLELTCRCNLRCRMCPQARERESGVTNRRAVDMSIDIARQVIDDAYVSFRPRPMIHLTGGEPLMHRHFVDVVAHAKNRGMRCSVTTNGSLLEPRAADLVHLGIDSVKVSLDGPERIHNEIRGADWSYERAMQGIQAIRRERDRQEAKLPSIAANCVITEQNYQHLPSVVDIAAEAGIETLSFQHLTFKDNTHHGMDIDCLIDQLPAIRSRAKERRVVVSLYPRMSVSQLRRYYTEPAINLGGTCLMPWFATRVLTDGSLSPCRNFVFGQVEQEGFSLRKAWNGERIRGYRRRIATLGLFSDCGRCCHRIAAR